MAGLVEHHHAPAVDDRLAAEEAAHAVADRIPEERRAGRIDRDVEPPCRALRERACSDGQ
jgi:hypothetical protein